jgi:hypothetical protein
LTHSGHSLISENTRPPAFRAEPGWTCLVVNRKRQTTVEFSDQMIISYALLRITALESVEPVEPVASIEAAVPRILVNSPFHSPLNIVLIELRRIALS